MNVKDQSRKHEHEDGHAIDFAYLLRPANRGLLLDLIVFVVNLFLMRLMLGQFVSVLRAGANGEPLGKSGCFYFLQMPGHLPDHDLIRLQRDLVIKRALERPLRF